MADLYALYRLLWKEPGYKVAWIERVCQLRKNIASLGFRASRRRVELATCEFQSTTATRGTGTPSAGRGKGRPTGPFTTTGIPAYLHMAGYRITPVLVFWTLRVRMWEFLRLWAGFELPSSWPALPCYGPNRNRNILDFMK
jgi:hypothetical protein